jgi:undecaprenyl-phosphate 4-deoxy-4-formamido-L-arabinose transferase
MFTFTGAQFLVFGLLGEYIGRIYYEVQARPKYYIQKIVGPTD